jgi:hypothetical protein
LQRRGRAARSRSVAQLKQLARPAGASSRAILEGASAPTIAPPANTGRLAAQGFEVITLYRRRPRFKIVVDAAPHGGVAAINAGRRARAQIEWAGRRVGR